jgi:hypothetical protein
MRDGRWSYLIIPGLVATLAACGGSTGPNPPPTPPAPTPTPCTQAVVTQDAGALPPSSVAAKDFSVLDAGRLDVTLDWTLPASNVGFYLVPAGTCTTLAEFNNRSCNFLLRSEPPGPKPRKVSGQITAGNYRWLVANFANAQESLSLQVVLSKGSCPAFGANTPPAAAAVERETESQPAVERMIAQ